MLCLLKERRLSMQKFFCDLCSSECSGSSSRRWERVSGDLGFETIVLRESNPVDDLHICDQCIIGMFSEIIERHSPELSQKKLQAAFRIKESTLAQREKEILIDEKALSDFNQQLRDKEKMLNEREARMNESKEYVIAEQLRVLRDKERELVRLAEARGRQQTIDNLDETLKEHPHLKDKLIKERKIV